MRTSARVLLLLALLASISFAETAPPFDALAGERWMGIYIRGDKAGWLHFTMRREKEGELERWVLSTSSVTRMTFLDRTLEVRGTTRASYLARAPYRLLAFESTTETGEGKVRRTAVRDRETFVVTVERGRAQEKRRADFRHTLSDVLAAELLVLLKDGPGKGREVRIFLEEELVETTGRVERAKPAASGEEGGQVEVVTSWEGMRQVARFDAGGTCLELRIGPAVVLKREEASVARRLGAGADLWALSHTEPLERPLGVRAGQVTGMVIEIEGVAVEAIPRSDRQQVRPAPGGQALVHIRRQAAPAKAGPAPEALSKYLASNARIPADHEKIRETASRAIGEGGTPFEKAGRLCAWVHANIEKQSRSQRVSALDVLEARAGDCTEHAILCTALCRASGLPARVVTGLVYCGDETRVFGVHAWVEAWCGSWVALDPAWGQAPADATHVKLSEGMAPHSLLLYTGKIRVKVIEVETE